MKKSLLLVCFIASILTIGSCSSDDNSDSQPTSKEALEKKLLGQWERYKITAIHTQEEIDPERIDRGCYFLDFKTMNYLSFKEDWSIYDGVYYPADLGRYETLSENSLLLTPDESKIKPMSYTVIEISKNELTLFLEHNEMAVQEHFRRVK